MITLRDTLDLIKKSFDFQPSSEKVGLEKAVGRISAKAVFSKYSVPMIHLSAMDGIAVRSEDTQGASQSNPVKIKDYKRVNTGNVIPPGYDSVIMIEDTWEDKDCFIIRKSSHPWQHIRPVGEDIGESEMIIPKYHLIRPNDIGALASYGVTEIEAISLSAGIIPTGSELVPFGEEIKPGRVIESNTLMAGAILESAGVAYKRYPIVIDEPDLIREQVKKGISENDFLLISAGSSAGTKDHTASIIAELGEVLVHGVAIKPGKPVIIGKIDGKPVIGLPGYPLASYTIMREIVCPVLEMFGFKVPYKHKITAEISNSLQSPIGTDEFVLMSVGRVDDRYVAVPQSRGAGVQMSAVRSNAFMKIPGDMEGISAGNQVEATLSVTPEQAEEAFLIIGSHDPCLDFLADIASAKGVDVHSNHVGSMGGIMALKKNNCHVAPVHLLADNGEYNIPYIRKFLNGKEIYLLCVAEREQGIVSETGISFDEIKDHTYINRQRGSGTRMLLDYLLKEKGISYSEIKGYEREVTTHLDVALAVRNGEAECGMCIYSAAKTLGLKFEPVIKERYELAFSKEMLKDPRMDAITECINSQEFKNSLLKLGGYDTKNTGEIRKA